MNIMLDLNVLMDYAQKREPHCAFSSIVISEVLKGNHTGYVPAHAVTTLYYLIVKYIDEQKANENTDWLLEHFEITPINKSVFERARQLQMRDFEDAVIAHLAETTQCQYIITRNLPDFDHSPISAITPEEFVRRFVTPTIDAS
jgi:predicted nucleic acid-binding protein